MGNGDRAKKRDVKKEAVRSDAGRADHLTFRLFDGRGGLLGEAVPLDAPPSLPLLPPSLSCTPPFSSLFLFNLLASIFSLARPSGKHRHVRFR